jgi:hypothetical protein
VAVAVTAVHPVAPLVCPALTASPGQTVAFVPAQKGNAYAIQMGLFAHTGAYLVYANRPRLRFARAFDHIASQRQRLAVIRDLAQGGRAPAGVDAVLVAVPGQTAGPCHFLQQALDLRSP